MKLLAALLLAPSLCLAQTIDQKAFSFRAPFTLNLSWIAKVQMETVSSAGSIILTGTAITPALDFNSDYMLLKLVGNKTTGVTVSSMRVTLTPMVVPSDMRIKPWEFSKLLQPPIALSAGAFLGCRYYMPLQKFDFSVTTAIKAIDTPGWLRCAVNVEPAAIPAEPVTVVGTVTPPPPPPAPAPTADSLVGDCIGSLPAGYGCIRLIQQPLVVSGNSWTLNNGIAFLGNTATSTPYSGTVVSLIRMTNSVRLVASNGVYQCWSGSAWGDTGC